MIPDMIPTQFAHQINLTALLKWQAAQADLEDAPPAKRDLSTVHASVADLFPGHKKAQTMSEFMAKKPTAPRPQPTAKVIVDKIPGRVPYFTEGKFQHPAESPKFIFCQQSH